MIPLFISSFIFNFYRIAKGDRLEYLKSLARHGIFESLRTSFPSQVVTKANLCLSREVSPYLHYLVYCL